MNKKIITISILSLISIFIIFFILNKIFKTSEMSEEKEREYANELKSKGLYLQAIEAYKEYLEKNKTSKRLRANLYYTIAEIYKNNLNDYENALKYYIKIKYIDPNNPLMQNINQKIVECLENSGRSREAQIALEESTLINNENKKRSDTSVIVAKIDSDIITLQDFNNWYNRIPSEIKSKYPDKKTLFKQFIGEELLYRMAIRKGLQNDPEILKETSEIKKRLMLQKVLNEELKSKINITENDLKLYYQANKSKYNNKPFNEVVQNIYNDLLQLKIEEQSKILFEKLLKANRVEIFDGNIK
jgi:tetratricopeptide (TPR) repeat protein